MLDKLKVKLNEVASIKSEKVNNTLLCDSIKDKIEQFQKNKIVQK